MDKTLEPGEVEVLSQPMFEGDLPPYTQVIEEMVSPRGASTSKRRSKIEEKERTSSVALQVQGRKTRSASTAKSTRNEFIDSEAKVSKRQQPKVGRRKPSQEVLHNSERATASTGTSRGNSKVVRSKPPGNVDTNRGESDHCSTEDESQQRCKTRGTPMDQDDESDEEEDYDEDLEEQETDGEDEDREMEEEEEEDNEDNDDENFDDEEDVASTHRHRIQIPAGKGMKKGVTRGCKGINGKAAVQKVPVKSAFKKEQKPVHKFVDYSKGKVKPGQEREFFGKIGDDWFLQYSKFQGKWYVGIRRKLNAQLSDWGYGAAFSVEVLGNLKKAIPELQAHIRKLE